MTLYAFQRALDHVALAVYQAEKAGLFQDVLGGESVGEMESSCWKRLIADRAEKIREVMSLMIEEFLEDVL